MTTFQKPSIHAGEHRKRHLFSPPIFQKSRNQAMFRTLNNV